MRCRVFFSTLFLLIFNVFFLKAQDGDPLGCTGQDIDDNCPLDTWVIVLALIAIVFAARHLYKQKKKFAAV